MLAAILASGTLVSNAQQLAFPGAQGWGRYAVGGRYGSVYHVTNLNDSGTGSLRDAVSAPNRIVVFDVAGVININSRITFSKNLYVAGQTAPGEGITVYGDGVSFSGATNSIIRYMRFRMGHGGSSGKDCAGVANGTTMIFDHCSFSWGLDETFSINSDGKGELHDFTISNCIIGQGLMSHSAGGLIQADNVTLYRNFYCDNNTRNNKVKGRNQYVNNIVYNWNNGAYIMGGDSEGDSYCNIENNLFINGPAGGGNAFSGGNSNFHCYVVGNYQDSNKDGIYAPSVVTNFAGADTKTTPYLYPELEKWEGTELIDKLLPTVGASLPYRDYVDCYMIDEVMSYGTEGALISNEATLFFGTPNTWSLWAGNKRIDTDKDGMPDEWETANGTDPNKNDAMVIAANGYANIENYINSLSEDTRDFYLRAPLNVEKKSATTSSIMVSWRDYTDGEEGFIVECDGKEVGRVAANVTSFNITGLAAGTTYEISVKAYKGDKTSHSSAKAKLLTKPEEVGILDIESFVPAYTWTSEVADWTIGGAGWKEGNYADGSDVLIADGGTVNLTEKVSPSNIVVNSDDNFIIKGTGSIGGNGSLNKAGNGVLTIASQSNSYTGPTVLHEGTLAFSTLKDGGVNSSLGASKEFAQNWIMDGGTYLYTGANTSTNRNAKLLSETEFSINNSTAAVTMNGTIEGNDNLVIGGKGKVIVGTDKFFGYTGSTILKGGTLYLSTPAISATGIGNSSKLVFAGGTLSTAGENNNYENYTFPIEVKGDTKSIFAPYRNCYLKSTVTGSGTLQINIPYVREYIQGNWSGFNGRIIAYANSSGNLFLLNNNLKIENGVVELKNGARCVGWDTNGAYTLGGLSGVSGTQLCGSSKQTNNFTCTWTIGTANTDETFAGVINNYSCSGSGHQGTTNIIKAGTGDWTLTGANEYSGTTTINGGRLVVNGSKTGTGAVTVNADATLAGTGSVSGTVKVKKDGEIYAGDNTILNRKTLTLAGKLSVSIGGQITIPVSYVNGLLKSNYLGLNGGAAFANAKLHLDVAYGSSAFEEGQKIRVFLLGTTKPSGSIASIYPETPGEGLEWDKSELFTTGFLLVKPSATAIESVSTAGNKENKIYDLNGRAVSEYADGIVIRGGKKFFNKK